MKVSHDGSLVVTRRGFCWGIVGAAPAGVFGGLAASLGLLSKDKGQTSEYVIINGWVITSEDVVFRREWL
jgi:hypothetical protein